jgi:hypothetical protein
MDKWIKCSERMPTYKDGKGRDNSVLCHLTDRKGDFKISGSCSVSVDNVQGWVDEGKCEYWTHLPDSPYSQSDAAAKDD